MVDHIPLAVTRRKRNGIFTKRCIGAADTLHVCVKNEAGTYELKTVTLKKAN